MHLRVVLDVGLHKRRLQDLVRDGHQGLHLVHQGGHKGNLLSILIHLSLCELLGRACLHELLVLVNLALIHDTH